MAKSFHELSSRSQLIVFVLLAVLTGGAAWQVLLSPELNEIGTRRERLTALDADVFKAQVTATRLPAAQREVRALEAALRETEAVIPEEKDPQDVLRNLHELASESLLDIASFKPKAVVAKAQYTEWPIELGLEGTYHDLGRFFDRIAAMSRLMSVSDLEIKTITRPNGRASITASCVATTFVFQKDLTIAVAGADHEATLFALALCTGSLLCTAGLAAQAPLPTAVAVPAALDTASAPALIPVGTRVGIPPSNYEDGGRRDPFTSLVTPKRAASSDVAAVRPRTGLGSVALADINVRGIMKTGATMVAILEAPDKQSYIAHAKDRLVDGYIQSIDADGVVFAEETTPGAKANTVRKSLRPAGEDVR